MLNKFVFIGMQESPKYGRVRHEWVSKREHPHKNRFTFRLRVNSPDNVLLGDFNIAVDKNIDWKPQNPNKEP